MNHCMTWNEFNEQVWRAAGLSASEIADGHKKNAIAMPGFGEQEAVLAPGKTHEQAIASATI